MTFAEWREKKKGLGYTEEQIAELSGVSLEIVHDVFSLQHMPDARIWLALDRALQQPNNMLRDDMTPYLTRGIDAYTVDDYYTMPDDSRVELIEGEIYNMSAPSLLHQMVSSLIWKSLERYIEENGGECIAFMAPVDVQLNCDEFTMVQPDVLVVCDRDKLKNKRCVFGAPDLVMEILSPSTKFKDISVKLMAYMNAGVREYWVVDAEKKRVVVYIFEEELNPKIYGFESKIPVSIFGGKCEIDFLEIYKQVAFLYE